MISNVLSLEDVKSKAPAAFSPIASPDLSASYAHVTTANVLSALQQDGWRITEAVQSKSRREDTAPFARHAIKLTHPELPTHREGTPQLHLGNAADGSSAFRLLGGFLRAACLNQSYAGVKVVGGVFYHRGGNLEERIVAGARDLRKNFDKVISAFDLWSEIQLSPEQREAFVRAALPLRWAGQEVAIGGSSVINPRRSADVGNDLFKVYNRTQEALIRGGFTASFHKRNEAGEIVDSSFRSVRKVTGIAANERINLGLWDLASSYAEKGGLVAA